MSLVVQHLTARYGDRAILSDVALQPLAAGQVVSLIGPNGAGKTTLMRAIAGLTPASGQVLLDGLDLNRMSIAERARHVAYMPQTLPQAAVPAQDLERGVGGGKGNVHHRNASHYNRPRRWARKGS